MLSNKRFRSYRKREALIRFLWFRCYVKDGASNNMIIGWDTNVLCYSLDPAYPEHEKLKVLLFNLFPRKPFSNKPNHQLGNQSHLCLQLKMGFQRSKKAAENTSETPIHRVLQLNNLNNLRQWLFLFVFVHFYKFPVE